MQEAENKSKEIKDMGKNPINPLTGKPKRGRPKKIVATDSNQLQFDFPGIMKAVERSDDAKGLLMAMLASRAACSMM